MTIPKFEPVGYYDTEYKDYSQVCRVGWVSIHPYNQLTEAYEAGKRDAIPEGWALVPKEILDRFPEINPSNYDHDDACSLNAWGVELVLAAAPKGEEVMLTPDILRTFGSMSDKPTRDTCHEAADLIEKQAAELETTKAYYEQVFNDGAARIAAIQAELEAAKVEIDLERTARQQTEKLLHKQAGIIAASQAENVRLREALKDIVKLNKNLNIDYASRKATEALATPSDTPVP